MVRTIDFKGTPIPDVDMSVTNIDTSIRREAKTDVKGVARLPLGAGSYALNIGGCCGPWQRVDKIVKLARSCTLTLNVTLGVREIAPDAQ